MPAGMQSGSPRGRAARVEIWTPPRDFAQISRPSCRPPRHGCSGWLDHPPRSSVRKICERRRWWPAASPPAGERDKTFAKSMGSGGGSQVCWRQRCRRARAFFEVIFRVARASSSATFRAPSFGGVLVSTVGSRRRRHVEEAWLASLKTWANKINANDYEDLALAA